jgi:signal transduction histidine kinase
VRNAFAPVAAAIFALTALPGFGQTVISLAEFNARAGANSAPTRVGQKVSLRGVVPAPAFHFPDYTLLAIQSGQRGAVLKTGPEDEGLNPLLPGDEVQASGVVEALGGATVLSVERISVTGHTAAPTPIDVSLRELNAYPSGVNFLGRLVRVRGEMLQNADTTAGPALLVGESGNPYKVFLPGAERTLAAFQKGDTVSAVGVAWQYCPSPPHNRFFELLLQQPSHVRLEARGLPFPPLALALALSVVMFISFAIWSRERRLQKQRERLHRTYQLGEEILSAESLSAILKRISEVLPAILGVTRVQLYVHNRASRMLEAQSGDGGEPVSVSLLAPPGGAHAGAVACFHYRTLLAIPDIEKSPFPITGGAVEAPKSLLLVPMVAQSDIMGVLELDQDDHARDFTADEQALAQHLGNQIAVAIRLLDQRSVQQHLFRTEKLAAVGRLISGIVAELQTPLDSIADLAAKALERGGASDEVAAIAAEAHKAAGMVSRMVAFGGAETPDSRQVCISTLLRSLIEFREADLKSAGIRVNDLISREPLFVMGSQGQLEQVFLNLLVQAEQSLTEASHKSISLRTSVLGRSIMVEISFSAAPGSRQAEEAAAVLSVIHSVVAGHGGEVRLIVKPDQEPRFEVDLPSTAKERAPQPDDPATESRRLTVLVIEPDETAQRQLLALLGTRGCRVVPVVSADAGLELSQRMRFDLALCSAHAPGLNWVELSERMQRRVGAFALISDRYDPELAADFEGDGRFVVTRPVREADLERIFKTQRLAALRNL